MAQRRPVVDRPLSKGKSEVSLSAFAFLFSEIIQYSQMRVRSWGDLEKRLEELGYEVGLRVLELVCTRDKNSKREVRLLNMLGFISSTVWKALFGKASDDLQRSTESEDEYMIVEKEPLVCKFISLPDNLSSGSLNCGAFAAGIVHGILDNAGFPARVSAHYMPQRPGEPVSVPRPTLIVVKFKEEVIARERQLG
eukprot:Rmarinus@m.6957